MASQRRRNTVHDLASLQLHPDGSRVHPRTSKSSYSRSAHHAVRDARGNWIAGDAGGTGRVARRRSMRKRAAVGGGGVAEDGDGEGEGEEGEERRDGDDAGADGTWKDPRAIKRRKFVHDLAFLDDPARSPAPPVAAPSPLPIPSSDLLKCIHHFASQYYAAHGQLVDASREARREKKARRLKRLQARAVEMGKRGDVSDVELESEDEEEEEEGGDDEGEEEVGDDEEDEEEEEEDTEQRRDNMEKKTLVRDMYKVFDGSALMAIGMLLQEHVRHLLSPRIPDGWEEAMEALAEEEEWERKEGASEEEEGEEKEGEEPMKDVDVEAEDGRSSEGDSSD